MKKLKIIVSHPIQYHAILWKSIFEQSNIESEVLFCSNHGQVKSFDKDFGIAFKWDNDLTAGYKHRFFKNYGYGSGASNALLMYINPGIIKEILFGSFDVLYLHGFGHLTHLLCIIIAKLRGKKVVLRNISYNISLDSRIKGLIKKVYYSIILRLPNKFLYIGKHNYNYYKDYSIPDRKLVFTPHVVDNDWFKEQYTSLKGQTKELKEAWGFEEGDQIFLFCGKLIEKKQPKMLLKSFLEANLPSNWKIAFVGTGVQMEELKEMSQDDNRVHFLGFLNQNEICKAYTIADVLVLPSLHSETWGLVINEALNFNCATIVSDRVGCWPELVENKTGLVFPYNQQKELTKSLEKLANDSELLAKYQKEATIIMKNHSVKEYIVSLKESIK